MYVGIDLHDHEAQVVVVVHDGNLQNEIRLPTDRLDELAEEYAGSEAITHAADTALVPEDKIPIQELIQLLTERVDEVDEINVR